MVNAAETIRKTFTRRPAYTPVTALSLHTVKYCCHFWVTDTLAVLCDIMDSNIDFVSTNSSYRLSRFSLVSKPKRVLTFIMFWKVGKEFCWKQSDSWQMRCCSLKSWTTYPDKSKPVAVAAHSKNCLQSAELLLYYQHRKFVSRAYENTGHFASREGISRDAGHMGRNTGCPGKYGTVGNPKWN